MKICTKCKQKKELSDFYKAREYKGKIYLASECKKCHDTVSVSYNKKYRKGNLEVRQKENLYRKNRLINDLNYHEKLKERKKESHKRCIVHNLWKRTKDRAIKKGIEFSLLENEIIIPECCPILEIPLFVGERKNYNNSPTIDRKDNSQGYTKENTAIISMLANTMKNSASLENLTTFTKNIFSYLNNN